MTLARLCRLEERRIIPYRDLEPGSQETKEKVVTREAISAGRERGQHGQALEIHLGCSDAGGRDGVCRPSGQFLNIAGKLMFFCVFA